MKLLKLTIFETARTKVAVNFDHVQRIEEQANSTCVIFFSNNEDEGETVHICESLDFIIESLKN